jgi:hypothetical protein
MNIQKGKTYRTANGGSVRIIADDRASMNGKHWVGLYNGDKGEWVMTYDREGNAYVFDTLKPELNIVPEKNKWWIVSYTDTYHERVKAEVLSADSNSEASIKYRIKTLNLVDAKYTLVEL